jgi:putative exosortase-associated protein (TIGR04073 family)
MIRYTERARDPAGAGEEDPMSRTVLVRAALLLGIVALVAAPGAAEAQSAARKCGRGLAAMTTGFLEIPGNMVKESRETNQVRGFTLGFVKGLGAVVVRELVGVYEFVTSPFAIPKGYAPIIQPEFPWDYFDEAPRGR